MKTWVILLGFIAAVWLKRRFSPDPLVETRRWEILGPFGPGEMPPDLQAQWEDLKRTGIGPGHPDF